MPVVSPSRYSSTSSSLTGSYRPTLNSSSSLEKPYLRTSSGTFVSSTLRSSYGDRTTEYKSIYSDVDGKRERKTSLVEYSRTTRAPSVAESDSGISRYRTERSESRSRDISTTRSESSKASNEARNSKRSSLNSAALAMSTVELYKKYSPNNYVPQIVKDQMQNQNNSGEISRSKSISNDIGRPPASDSTRLRRARNSMAATITERPEGRRSLKESSPSSGYARKSSMSNGLRDDNGNEVPSVSEIRKRFDPKMTVTKLPANENRYIKSSVDQYLNHIKDCENGTVGYTKLPKDDKPVPVHLPYIDKNGASPRWEIGSSSSRSNSNSDISVSVTIPEPSLAKTTHTARLPSERLASIKSQLDPNNPIGKILEKSTVIQVENGHVDRKHRNGTDVNITKNDKESHENDIEKQVKVPKHTSNFASYIQISQPIATGTSKSKHDVSGAISEETSDAKSEPRKRLNLKYIDSETESRLLLENDIDSPSGTGFENKTFEHENFLKKRSEKDDGLLENGVKSMETSTESAVSDPSDDLSLDTTTVRKKIPDINHEDVKSELAGGKSGISGVRRSSERSESSEPRGTEKSSHTSGLNGLRNIGNTCFMNSVVQCLSNTRPLLEYLTEDRYCNEINTTLSCMKGALIKAFASVIKELWEAGEKDSVVNTTSLKSQVQRFAPRFMGYSQQDAQEFLRYLLEGLHEDVNRITVKPKPILTEIDESLSDGAKASEARARYRRRDDSAVSDTFVGQLKSTLRCTHCQHDSVTFDPFWDLSLPIPGRGGVQLQQCLQLFTKHEELDGDEKPTCSKCGVRRKCLKWFTVQKFPQVLVIHLKRFSPMERFRGKLSVLVEFPLNGLDMAPYAADTNNKCNYNLYAVSNHSGTTYSGHYTAYCKHPYTGDWHEYNDSRVTPISPRNVVSSEAYVLFYELERKTHT